MKKNVIEQRIITSFLSLATKKPIEKITVSELCVDCGIQRQTFYNHYSDIDALIETIFDQEGYHILGTVYQKQNWQESLTDILLALKTNEDFVIAVYQGVSRERLERCLYARLYSSLQLFIDQMEESISMKEDEKKWIIAYHTYAFMGCILDWIRFGMKTRPEVMVHNIDMVIRGSFLEAINRYKNKV